MKILYWVGDAKENLREFRGTVQDEAGTTLRKIQYGQTPVSACPLNNLAKGVTGVYELKIDHDKETYRVVYVAKLAKGVYVLHAFLKKSKSGIGIPPKDKDIILRRYKMARQHDGA
ncbi:protein of unknown function DUF891 [Solidesulfovibrio carbinoliphilus subsp. oakridgensis]|uniref:Type II toxin-antitoxin system RelE/ParE family toxin n=1 Tax=Solidesulfovibrio carbinoliphilus subsp. oakridgensis TaxID=694327 RepID=G7Q6U7_9BACT|nr:type II toxin-antitoxin system RelE/ParE family toxin [Solidesulfovibrio carbinoliphilus]EHJ48032.1 protein of unknown function DUF891 [Solidesulfovibrio carbinoliphilus subsp. oakridgensis]